MSAAGHRRSVLQRSARRRAGVAAGQYGAPAADTATVASTALMIAAACPASSTPWASPIDTTAEGTPSAAVASSPTATGLPQHDRDQNVQGCCGDDQPGEQQQRLPGAEQRTELQSRAQGHEEQRHQEALGDADQLLGQPPGLPHRRKDRARGEPGDEDARARSGGQGGEPEQPGKADAQIQRPSPVLGFPPQRMHPVGAPQPTQRRGKPRHPRAGPARRRPALCPDRRWPAPAGRRAWCRRR